MKRPRLILPVVILLVIAAAVSVSACGEKSANDGRIGMIVSVLPQAEFAETVGGDKVNVTVMVPPGADPHTYELTPSQMRKVSKARLYAKVGSGVEFELAWLNKLIAQNRNMGVIDCSEGIVLAEGIGEDEHDDGIDPHIWMSPVNAKIMVQNICAGLVEIDPANQTYYEANRDAYLQKLTQLDQEIREGLSGVTNRIFMVYHPAFGYFASEYNLTMLPIQKEGKEPTASGLASLIDQAKEYNIRVIFAETQFNPQSAKVIAKEIGGKVIMVDPLARDYIVNMQTLADEMIQAMN
ncbi:MAG: zinc ABC transporter substrate-binding protein [Dehalococcoidia bacterium]|nr:zinc ABC transporter substrate-binding protein [Dehalococcoidia bacterium]